MEHLNLSDEYALIGSTLIDVNTKTKKKDTIIIIKDGIITHISTKKDIELPKNIEKIDLTGKYIMPGLIDVHMHFGGTRSTDYASPNYFLESKYTQAIRSSLEARKVLEVGFTTVRSCGSKYDVSLKQVIESGELVGPRLIASGPCICSIGDDDIRRDIYEMPFDLSSDADPTNIHIDGGIDNIRKNVRILCNQNVDHIKLKITGTGSSPGDRQDDITFSRDEVRELILEAKRHHKRTAVHCQCKEATQMAIELGANTIEHADCKDGICIDKEMSKQIIEKDIILVPTLAVKQVGPWGQNRIGNHILQSYRTALESGVKFALGSDSFAENLTPYGLFSLNELKLFIEVLGFTPIDAITAATKIGAEACGMLDEVGSLDEGKSADFIVLDKDPTQDIAVLLDRKNKLYIVKKGNDIIRN